MLSFCFFALKKNDNHRTTEYQLTTLETKGKCSALVHGFCDAETSAALWQQSVTEERSKMRVLKSTVKNQVSIYLLSGCLHVCVHVCVPMPHCTYESQRTCIP